MRLLLTSKVSAEEARRKGYDFGLHGANETNCHFSLFSSPELTKAWEEGKRRGTEESARRKSDKRDRR